MGKEVEESKSCLVEQVFNRTVRLRVCSLQEKMCVYDCVG